MVLSGMVWLWPREFQIESLTYMAAQRGFQRSFLNSLYVTLIGTALNIAFTVFGAYPLSRKRLKGRKWILFVIVFTMLFSGGLIPSFILVQRLGLMNSLGALIWPGLTSPFFIIILRNFFEGIPDSLEESARIDGASNFKTLLFVMLPLALPCLATLTVFYAVGHWNNYFGALLYIQSREKFTLQLYLQQLLVSTTRGAGALINTAQMRALKNKAPMIIQASAVFLSTVPILLVYPFLQKYYVKGMTLGAVKG
jgi:putative aldouronate transport system permease protein